MFEDYSDFENGNWNGWTPGEGSELDFSADGHGLELPRQTNPVSQVLLEKEFSNLQPGKTYALRLRLRLRDDAGGGAQKVRFAVDDQLLPQYTVDSLSPKSFLVLFTAKSANPRLYLKYEHVPGEGLEGGDFRLDDLELRAGETVDLTTFEEGYNGWVKGSNAAHLDIVADESGGHHFGTPEPVPAIVNGPVLEKTFSPSLDGDSYTFSLRASKASFGHRTEASVQVSYRAAAPDSPVQVTERLPIVGEDWHTREWTLEPEGALEYLSITVREAMALGTPGLLIDDLLVQQVLE